MSKVRFSVVGERFEQKPLIDTMQMKKEEKAQWSRDTEKN